MARDVRVGKSVSFSAEELCRALQGQYNGPARQRLRDSIQRLQQALLKFETFSVQLCQRFDYPSQGRWTVALDPQIVELFSRVPPVWLDLGRRLSLPEGLSTWLYAFVESQTSLIPMKTEALRVLCGSESSSRAFENKLRDALKHLNEHGVIDEGWSIREGRAALAQGPSFIGVRHPGALPRGARNGAPNPRIRTLCTLHGRHVSPPGSLKSAIQSAP